MSKIKRVATTAATIVAALGIGYVMQNLQQAPDKEASLTPVPVSQVMLDSSGTAMPEPQLDLASITLTSVDVAPQIGRLTDQVFDALTQGEDVPVKTSAPVLDAPAAPADPVMPQLGCDVLLRATPAPMASVTLSLDAPCNPNERLTVHHTGMMFTATTSDSGHLDVTVPALSRKAVFVVELSQGAGAVATAEVPDLGDFDRIVLQWSGNTGFQLHAREFGAAYGSAGHVWSGATETSGDEGLGHVTRLGDSELQQPNLVEIYSFPLNDAHRAGTVDLSVEAEVTAATCGRDIAAQSIELRRDAAPVTQDLTLSMPECSDVGGFLVLNNLVDNLKIAAR